MTHSFVLVEDSEYRQEVLRNGGPKQGNMFGLIVSYDEALGKNIPVTCFHGGSGYLCPECAARILQEQ